MSNGTVKTERFAIGADQPMCLIAGPCALEHGPVNFETARHIKKIADELGITYVFKGSFDKANRTSVKSYRGPGFDEGLEILGEIRDKLDIPVLTDVHEPNQVDRVADVVDILQIPAFLCRQTDLLVAAGKSGKVVNVKKGQFLSPHNMDQVIGKIQSTGNDRIVLTERGSFFGYTDLVVDMRSIPTMQQFGFPVIYDAGHSLQKPGAAGTHTGGEREMIPFLARGAVAVGCDGVFLEVHPKPEESPSDSQTIWPLDKTHDLILALNKLYNFCQNNT